MPAKQVLSGISIFVHLEFIILTLTMPSTSKPLYFILITFFIVFAISFLGNSFTIMGIKFNNINILSDVLPAESEDTSQMIQPLVQIEVADSIPDYRSSTEIIGYEEEGVLKAFIRALKDLRDGKRAKVRIAYFGDSMIEGDLVTQDVRKLFQDYFGGNGVGFVPITSIVAGFRQTIQHSFSESWQDEHFLNTSLARSGSIFLSGHRFRPGEGSSVSYSGVNRSHLGKFSECYLLYGRVDSTGTFSVNDSVQGYKYNSHFNRQLVSIDQQRIHARFGGHQNEIYGFSFESPRGVFVDNFSFRGISGTELQKISEEMLMSVNEAQPYDLIIIQYGPNLLFKPDLIDFRWYEKPFERAVATLKRTFPKASILIVGSADKATKYDGEYKTQKGVLPLIEIQNKVAYETKTNFWSLYNAMGGKNSMIRWVHSSPPLANLDYTHLTHKGATTVARLLFDKLIQVYDPEAASRSQIQPIVRYVAVSRGI